MDPSPRSPLRHRLLVGVVALLTVCGLAAAPTVAGAQSASGEDSSISTPDPRFSARPDSRIVGGTEAADGAWPSQVALLFHDTADNFQAQYCGGTLIARNWVLTAGHCVRDSGFSPVPSDVDVLVGTQDLQSGGTRIRAVEFRIHPSWNPSEGRSDLALIRLDKPAPAPIPVQSITAQNVSPPAFTDVTTTGWGTTAYGEPDYPTKLRQVTVDVSTPGDCQNGYPGFYQQSTMVCAAAPGKDSCQGDSGGPLVENRSGTWVQVGIVSTGNECALAGFPGIYTRVAAFSNWIKEQIRYGAQPNAQGFINRMYLDAYNRGATAAEISSGVANFNNGQLPEVYAHNLLNQATYQTRTGGVIRLYRAVFLRKPDTAGLVYWWREVNRGVSLKRIADLMVTAPEFELLYGELDNVEFVEQVYDNVLDRAPSTNERNYWVGELNSGARSRGQVMVGFSESPEYKGATATSTRVIGPFFALLRRVPVDADITYWGGQSQQSLVTTLIKSWEYANRF
ncbi:MAG TPA: trypsin-like serine protease [Iamia sp.]|nr:trypsin-like serine protease [Iamia sp.]